MDAKAGPLSVTVAVLTFRRPLEIDRVLPMLLAQAAEVSGSGDVEAGVLVVDNDPVGGAESTVKRHAQPALRYVVEPQPGISAARNRALADAGTDILVFIDDDETPHDGWLAAILDTRERFAATAVAGTVVSGFDGPLDPWVAAGGFFVRRNLVTGTAIDKAATNNLLLDLRRVRALDLRFETDLGLSGGEDTMFTAALRAAGEPMVWCREAVVTDVVPMERTTRRWVLQRAMSYGNTAAHVSVRLARGSSSRLRTRLEWTARGLARIAGGGLRFVVGVVRRSLADRARGLRTVARGVGMVSGSVGWVYQEYRREGRRKAKASR